MSELPPDASINISELEREQLRFFLADGDLGTTLIELNPSLAWLSYFADLNLQQKNEAALAAWVGKNLDSVDAVREVVARIHLFKTDSARILDHQLNAQRDRISLLLTKCWQLIIRHIHNAERGKVQNEWFEVLPHIKRGEISPEMLMRVTRMLTPQLFVEKRYGWYEEPEPKLERPTDILSVKYRVEDGVSEADFFSAWPKDAVAEVDAKLIAYLTLALSLALADAIDVGVESNTLLSISDIDVPSVAAHEQNAYREGFQPIVRITAELWSRLIRKDVEKALSILHSWASN
jgi:hypothetical protein